jgi:cell division septation protein DedD
VYSLTASAADHAGNNTTDNATIRIDSVPPAISVSASPVDGDGGWYVSPAIVSATSSDATSGVADVQMRVDGGAWQDGSTVTMVTDGTHTVEFQAWDQAGNHASTSPLTVQVDRTPPIVAAGLTAPDGLNGWYISPVTITANSSDAVSGLASQGISLDGSSWAPSLTISTDGTTTIQVHAQDNAGNSALSSKTIRVDTTAPSVSLLLPPADGNNGWYVSPLTVSASGSDETSGVGSQQVSLDGITWSASLTLSQDGVYSVQGRVTDNAGNSTVSSVAVHVDTTMPSVSVLLPPADGENSWYVSPVNVTASGSDAISGVASQLVSLDGNTWSASLTLSQDGVYTVQGRVTDNAGNNSASSVAVHVDAIAPSAGLLLPPADGENGWYISPVTVSASGSDPTSGVGSQMVSLDGITWSSSLSLSLDGIYAVQGHVTDNAGNTTTVSETIQIDHTQPSLSAPALTGTPGQAGWYTSSVGVSVDATDLTSGMASLLYLVDSGAWLPGPLTLTDGRHTIQVQGTDRAGNVSTESQLVEVDSTPPQSGFVSPAEGSVAFAHGREFVMRGLSADVTSRLDEAQISLDGGSTWQPLAASPDGSWSYTWDTTTVANGPHVVLVSAGDLAGNQEHTARITVIVANLGPSVSISDSFWVYQQAEVGFSAGILPITGARIMVSDGSEHSRTFSYSASSLPSNFQWDGSWDDGSKAGPGSYQVEVSAWDMFGNDAHAVGTVQIPYPRQTPTVLSSPQGTPTQTPTPTATPTPTHPAATPSRPPATPVPTAPVLAETPKPETPVQRPPRLWPLAGFVALLAALATASLSDPRPRALDALGKALEDLNLPGEQPQP